MGNNQFTLIKQLIKERNDLVKERELLISNQNEMLDLFKWISRATNSPEIGIKCDLIIKNTITIK